MANTFKSHQQNGQPIHIYANQPSAPSPAEPEPALVEAPVEKEEEAPLKRYKQIHQYWSELEMIWKDRKDEERTAEEEAAARKLLFVRLCLFLLCLGLIGYAVRQIS